MSTTTEPTWRPAWYQMPNNYQSIAFKFPELCQVMKVKLSLAGTSWRVLFSNYYGVEDLTFDQCRASFSEDFSGSFPITVNGQTKFTIAKGQLLTSDPIVQAVAVGTDLYLQLTASTLQKYADVGCTCEDTFVNAIQSRTLSKQPTLKTDAKRRKAWFSIVGIEVLTSHTPRLINFTGDSLIDMGMITTPLMQALVARYPNQVAFVKTAISGNRLLTDAPTDLPTQKTFGEALITRLEHQPFAGKADLVVASIGINDLLLPYFEKQPSNDWQSATTLLKGYEQLVALVQAQHAKLLLLTLTPFDLTNKMTQAQEPGEATRQAVNQVLQTWPFVVASAEKLQAPTGGLKPVYDFGDHLHLNRAGGQVIADDLLPKITSLLFG